jgi:hypothetical protein
MRCCLYRLVGLGLEVVLAGVGGGRHDDGVGDETGVGRAPEEGVGRGGLGRVCLDLLRGRLLGGGLLLLGEGVAAGRLLAVLEALEDDAGLEVAVLGPLCPLGLQLPEQTQDLNEVAASLEA